MRSSAQSLLGRAEQLLEQGAREEALQTLRELFIAAPDHAAGRVLLARLHAEGGARRLAIGVLEEVLAGEPSQLSAGLLLARLLAAEGQWREARLILDRMSGFAPSDVRVSELRAALSTQTALSTLRGEDPFDRPAVAERLEAAGKLEEALGVWLRIAEEHPSEPILGERIAALQELLESPEGEVDPLPSPRGGPKAKALLQRWERIL